MIKEKRAMMDSELRAGGDDESPELVGYPAVFNSTSLDLGGFRERILPGAFSKTLRESDQVALWSHKESEPFARRSAGTLDLWEDEHGLATRILPDGTSWSSNAFASVRSGTTKHMSFGFMVIKDRFSEDPDTGDSLREVSEVALIEVSPVSNPAYLATEIQARQVRDLIGVLTDREERNMDLIEALQRKLPGHVQPPVRDGEEDRIYRLPLALRRQAMTEKLLGV